MPLSRFEARQGEVHVATLFGDSRCIHHPGIARAKGLDVSHVHVRYVWPLPENLGELLHSYDNVLVPEMNTGQFKTVLRDQFLVDAKPLNKVSGQPFRIAEIEAAIEEALA